MATAPTNSERAAWLLRRVQEVIGEHCHSFVFAAELDWPTKANPDGRHTVATFDGGLNTAMGVTRRLDRWLQTQADLADECGPDEDSPETPEEEGIPFE